MTEDTAQPNMWVADARTGQTLWRSGSGADNGRGVSGDVWAGSPGAEAWSSPEADFFLGDPFTAPPPQRVYVR